MDSNDKNLCLKIYEEMKLGTKNKDVSAAIKWLEAHKILFCWINGKYWAPDTLLCYGEVDLGNATHLVADGSNYANAAFKAAGRANVLWEGTNQQQRRILLNEISRELSLRKKLFTHFYDLLGLKNDFDLFLDYFNFYSGSSAAGHLISDWKTVGAVFVTLSDTTPQWFLGAISAAALWAGCSLIITPSLKYPVFPFILAEICSEVGLPEGVINIVPSAYNALDTLINMDFGKIVCSSSYSEGVKMNLISLIYNFSSFVFGHTSFIIFESCDVDGAIDKLFSENWEYQQQSEWSADLILVQESIYKVFVEKLTSKMKNININDLDFKFKENESLSLPKIMEEAEKFGVKIYKTKDASGSDQILMAEYDLDLGDPFEPITKLLVFKTAKHAVDIVNKHPFCLGTSIWTENLSQAMEVSSELETFTIWLNCHGVSDASVPIQMFRKSGTGVLGGIDGGLDFLTHGTESQCPWEQSTPYGPTKDFNDIIKNSNKSFKKWKHTRNRKEYLLKTHDQIKTTIESGSPTSALSEIVKFWALNGNSYNVTMSTRKDGLFTAQSKKPIGVIAMHLDEGEDSVTNFVSWVTPAIALGNVVVMIVSEETHSELQPIIKCFFDNLPNGVLNVITGLHHIYNLVKNPIIQAVWTKNNSCDVVNDISISRKFSFTWSPPCPVPMNNTLFVKHCLKNQVIWFPTTNSSG